MFFFRWVTLKMLDLTHSRPLVAFFLFKHFNTASEREASHVRLTFTATTRSVSSQNADFLSLSYIQRTRRKQKVYYEMTFAIVFCWDCFCTDKNWCVRVLIFCFGFWSVYSLLFSLQGPAAAQTTEGWRGKLKTVTASRSLRTMSGKPAQVGWLGSQWSVGSGWRCGHILCWDLPWTQAAACWSNRWN